MESLPIPAKIGPDEIRSYRKAMALSQRALAEALGVSTRAVEEWEAGRNPAQPFLRLALERLAITFGARTDPWRSSNCCRSRRSQRTPRDWRWCWLTGEHPPLTTTAPPFPA